MRELFKVFVPGEKIQLEVINKQGETVQLVSQVESLNSDGTFEVLTPLLQGKLINLITETIVRVVLPKGDAVYQFKGKIVGKSFKRLSTLRIEPITDLLKIQRRNHFRVKLIKDITIKMVENLDERIFGKPISGTILDISSGGMSITCAPEFFEGDWLELEFEMRGRIVAMLGSIRRKLNNDFNARYKHSYGVRFENITQAEHNEIARYVIEEQRKLIKKGLI